MQPKQSPTTADRLGAPFRPGQRDDRSSDRGGPARGCAPNDGSPQADPPAPSPPSAAPPTTTGQATPRPCDRSSLSPAVRAASSTARPPSPQHPPPPPNARDQTPSARLIRCTHRPIKPRQPLPDALGPRTKPLPAQLAAQQINRRSLRRTRIDIKPNNCHRPNHGRTRSSGVGRSPSPA